jgi:hypothetical protein
MLTVVRFIRMLFLYVRSQMLSLKTGASAGSLCFFLASGAFSAWVTSDFTRIMCVVASRCRSLLPQWSSVPGMWDSLPGEWLQSKFDVLENNPHTTPQP